MNKAYRLVILIAIFQSFISCQKEKVNPDQSESFIKFYGGSGDQSGLDLKECNDGGFIILGNSNSGLTSEDLALIKTDRNGNNSWTKTYGGNFADSASSIQVLPEGYLLVGSTYESDNSSDIYMLKTDLEGHPVLTKTYGQPGLNEKGFASDYNNSGGFIIYGSQEALGEKQGVLLIDVDANGGQKWSKPFDRISDTASYWPVRKIISIGDELLYGYSNISQISGYSTPTIAQYFYINNEGGFAYKKSDLIEPDKSLESLKDFFKTRDGNYLLCGLNSSNQLYLLKTEKDVAPITWKKTYNLSIDTEKEIFINESSDGYLLSATSESGDIMLIKTNPQGDIIFTKTFGGTGQDIAGRVIPVSDGGIALTGTISFESNKMITLIKTDKNGEITLK